jgi:hypothetical protein
MKPLSVPIPLDYADALGVDRTHLAHVNAGRRQLNALSAIKLMDLAEDDPRLKKLTIFMLRPEAMAYHQFFLRGFKKQGQRSCPILKEIAL